MINLYPGACYHCGNPVEAGKGYFGRYKGAGRLQHTTCMNRQRAAEKPDLRPILIAAALRKGSLSVHKYRYRDESARSITHKMLKAGLLREVEEDREHRYYVPTQKLRDLQAQEHPKKEKDHEIKN
jgi:hypothetical protein